MGFLRYGSSDAEFQRTDAQHIAGYDVSTMRRHRRDPI